MRKIVDNNNYQIEFDKIMEEITKDSRWPSVTVSRSIGINGIVMFMAMYKILNIETYQITDYSKVVFVGRPEGVFSGKEFRYVTLLNGLCNNNVATVGITFGRYEFPENNYGIEHIIDGERIHLKKNPLHYAVKIMESN